MCRSSQEYFASSVVAWHFARSISVYLDIVYAVECSGGPHFRRPPWPTPDHLDSHNYYPPLRRGRSRHEGKSARQTGAARYQHAQVPGARLAHAVPADAVTMHGKLRSPTSTATGAGPIILVPTAHSCDLRIGGVTGHSRVDPDRAIFG